MYEKIEGDNPCDIPKRHILTALSFMGLVNLLTMKVCLSVAIVAMTNSSEKAYSNIENSEVECPNLISSAQMNESQKFIGARYNWDAQEQGLILGAYYYGTTVTQIPGSVLSQRMGAKWTFGLAVLTSGILNLLTPLVTSWGSTALITVRVIEGLGEGAVFAALNQLVSRWSPKIERTRLSGIIFSGNYIGSVLGMSTAGWLSSIDLFGGWPSVFYLFGSLSCIWFLFWTFLVYETPAEHPRISTMELEHIHENNEQPMKKPETPWKAIFSSLPVWAVLVLFIGEDFGFFMLLSDVPTYLSTVLHFNIGTNALLSALPFTVRAVSSWIASYFADSLRKSNTLSITTIRKIFTAIALFGSAVCLLIITISGCRPYLIISMLTLGMALGGCFNGFVIIVDMSPTFSGIICGIIGTAACISASLGPAVVSAFTNKGATMANWNNVFYITAGIYALAAIFFVAFGSAELQPWDSGKEVKEVSKL